MQIDSLRTEKLTFKNTFFYLKEVFLGNFVNFLKLLSMWILFSAVFFFLANFLPDSLVAILSVVAYVVFYLFYLAFISQSRATINMEKVGVLSSLKDVYEGFLDRKAFDLVEIIPISLIFFLISFFPSSIFAIPIAFIMTLATIFFVFYTILAQPVMVIKKMSMFNSVKKGISLINGYFTFTLGLIMTFVICSLIIYWIFSYIRPTLFIHQVLTASVIGGEIMLFAIMITIIYTNLEVAWSTGFKTYAQGNTLLDNPEETNHEFTEFFKKVPEMEIKEDSEKQEDFDDE